MAAYFRRLGKDWVKPSLKKRFCTCSKRTVLALFETVRVFDLRCS
jgi:hypothetical protein